MAFEIASVFLKSTFSNTLPNICYDADTDSDTLRCDGLLR